MPAPTPTPADHAAAEEWHLNEPDDGPVNSYLAGVLAERRREKWLPIEAAPKDGTEILVFREYASPVAVARWHNLDPSGRGFWLGVGIYEPTHWQPLPEPPAPPAGDEAK